MPTRNDDVDQVVSGAQADLAARIKQVADLVGGSPAAGEMVLELTRLGSPLPIVRTFAREAQPVLKAHDCLKAHVRERGIDQPDAQAAPLN